MLATCPSATYITYGCSKPMVLGVSKGNRKRVTGHAVNQDSTLYSIYKTLAIGTHALAYVGISTLMFIDII